MDPERRYSEDEVARILDEATEAQKEGGAPSGGGTGMSLRELQEIGAEVGIPAELIRAAAARLEADTTPDRASRELLGTTIGVGRTVQLARMPTDEEWGRLVSDLRSTFQARGRVREEGQLRQWTNGNLHALVEPTGTGAQLRLGTLKSDAAATLGLGWAMIAIAIVYFVVELVTGGLAGPSDLRPLLLLGGIGGIGTLVNRVRLGRWAETRRLQMDGISARVLATIGADAPLASGEPTTSEADRLAPGADDDHPGVDDEHVGPGNGHD